MFQKLNEYTKQQLIKLQYVLWNLGDNFLCHLYNTLLNHLIKRKATQIARENVLEAAKKFCIDHDSYESYSSARRVLKEKTAILNELQGIP